MVKIETEFPCGMKTKVSGFSIAQFMFGVITSDTNDEEWLCPLHGKDCPPKHTHKTTKR